MPLERTWLADQIREVPLGSYYHRFYPDFIMIHVKMKVHIRLKYDANSRNPIQERAPRKYSRIKPYPGDALPHSWMFQLLSFLLSIMKSQNR